MCLHVFYPAVRSADYLRPGTNDPMPGLIGKAYEEMGGTVHYVGKPHPLVYEECFKALKVAIFVYCSVCLCFTPLQIILANSIIRISMVYLCCLIAVTIKPRPTGTVYFYTGALRSPVVPAIR